MTQIVISGLNISPYALRGAVQTLEHIDGAAQMSRTVNGSLLDISDPLFRKYRSTITGNDQVPPSFDGVWPGNTVVVDCAIELSYKTEDGSTAGGSAAKTVVTSRVDGDYTFYRPRLTMKVLAFNVEYNEWAALYTWTIDLEEV